MPVLSGNSLYRITRQDLEIREKAILAPFAMCSADSRGRVRPEEEDLYRTAYQRDRDRILHAKAFRRLAHKTQVRPLPSHDHVRSRLTHSVEVAQIGRTIARALGCNEDLVEAICLAHDLGHPPFGHEGEGKLNELMADVGGFDHQAHALRLVTVLERRRPQEQGLNLTYEVREGIVKHDPDFTPEAVAGYCPRERATLEAQLSNLADEIAYGASDLDDYLRSIFVQDLSSLMDSLGTLEICRRLLDEPRNRHLRGMDLRDSVCRSQFISALLTLETRDCIHTTAGNVGKAGNVADVRQRSGNLADHSSGFHAMNRELKEFLSCHFYNHDTVRSQTLASLDLMEQVFQAYLDRPDSLPPELAQSLRTDNLAAKTVIGEYMAGMTDRFLYETACKLGLIGEAELLGWYSVGCQERAASDG